MKEPFLESLLYTTVTVIGSLIPFILLGALIYFEGNPIPEFTQVFGKGELTIVCISLCITVIYSVSTYKNTGGTTLRFSIVFWPTLLFVIIGIGIYAAELKDVFDLTNSDISQKNLESNVDVQPILKGMERIVNFSIFFLIWTTVATILSRFFEKSGVLSIDEKRRNDVNKLQTKVENGKN